MIILITIIQLLIFYGYVAFIQSRYGVLTSISASTYYLQGQQRWLFLAFLWSIALLNLFQGMGAFGFFTSAGLLFSGIAIDHNSSGAHTDKVHFVGTIGAIIANYLGLYILYGMWIPSILLIISIALLYKHKKFIWYTEIVAMTIGIGSYLLR